MNVEVKVPAVGESITEGVIASWNFKDGDIVEPEESLFELETDKITLSVPAERGGRLKILTTAGSTVQIGSVVALIETDVAEQKLEKNSIQTPPQSTQVTSPDGDGAMRLNAPAGEEQLKERVLRGSVEESLSPSVRRMIAEHSLDPALIPATGKGGRLTKEDISRYLEHRQATVSEAKIESAIKTKPIIPPSTSPVPAKKDGELQTRKPLSPLRARVAERLVLAQQNAAILTTFNEVDMSAILTLREKYKESFIKRFGVKLGIMSFFIKASVDALKAVPEVNGWIDGDEIVQNHYYDIGVAVSTERGLVVPVIRGCDELSFAEIELQIADFARKAAEKALTLDDLTGGVFTVSNGGVFGSLLSTPILNPPQSAILGMHGIKKRPVVVGTDDRIEVRPMMYLALSYDHRIIDGREAVTFLKRIVDCIEDPERMFLGV